MLAAPGRGRGLRRPGAGRSSPTTPRRSPTPCATPRRAPISSIVVAGSSAGRDDYTAAVVERLGTLAVHGVAVRPGHPVVLGAVDATPVLGAPGYPVSASLTFDIFAAPVLAALEGATPTERPRARARVARKLASSMGMDDWVRVRLGRVGGELVATPLPRGAGVLTSLVRADGLLVVPAGLEGHHAGEHVDVDAAARRRGDRPHDRRGRLARPRPRPRRLRAARRRSRGDARLVERRIARRPGRAARRSVPRRRLAPARPRDGRVHAAVRRPRPRPDRDDRGRPSRAPRPGADRRAGQPARPDAHRRRRARRRPLRQPSARRGHARPARPRARAAAGIAPDAVTGYAREEHTHLAVAAAVAAGRADAGLGIMAAARAFDLDFVPVTREPYDLVLDAEMLEDPVTAPLWALLASPGSGPRSRRSAATTPARWAAGSADDRESPSTLCPVTTI